MATNKSDVLGTRVFEVVAKRMYIYNRPAYYHLMHMITKVRNGVNMGAYNIDHAFIWDGTPMGQQYWSNIDTEEVWYCRANNIDRYNRGNV